MPHLLGSSQTISERGIYFTEHSVATKPEQMEKLARNKRRWCKEAVMTRTVRAGQQTRLRDDQQLWSVLKRRVNMEMWSDGQSA
jgi:hypothetical protein